MRIKILFPLVSLISISLNVESQNIDTGKLESAFRIADSIIENSPGQSFKNLESLIVYYDGKIRFEKYYNGTHRDSLHHIQSQTKSIVSLLMGIAIDKGFVKSENEKVGDYFPEYFCPLDTFKSSLTIKDVLTMTAGFDWKEMLPPNDPANDNMNMYRSNNYLDYILSRPIIHPPSSIFLYNSGCPMIVAGIVEKSSRMRLDKFAEANLFGPLEINNYYWIKDTTGFCHAGGGLYLKPADVLKIGILVLDKGKWNGRQIISEQWIQKATAPYIKSDFENNNYGFFWWTKDMALTNGKNTTMISAQGAGGQKLYIFPEYRLIVAFSERNYTTPQVSPIFIRESIIPLLSSQ